MKFAIKKGTRNVVDLVRSFGYAHHGTNGTEYNFVRRLSGMDYPRLHVYVKEDTAKGEIILNMHIDQKKPSYHGSAAKGREYEGALLDKERERIEKLVSKN